MAESLFNTYKKNAGVIVNIVNTIIGVGIITIPRTFYTGGFFFVLFIAIVCMLLIFYTSYLMVQSASKRDEIQTYGELCRAAHGEWLQTFLCAITFLQMFGFVVVYLITLRKEIEDFVGDITEKTFKYGTYSLLAISLPIFLICSLRKLSYLAFPSLISMCCVVFVVFVTIYRSVYYHDKLVKMTKTKMKEIEKSLNIERAIWICEFNPNENINVKGGFTAAVAAAKNSDYCQKSTYDWDKVSAAFPEGTDYKEIGIAHSAYLFERFSLNAEGAKKELFSRFQFIRKYFFVSFGIMASAFIFQQGAIESFRDMRSPGLKAYRNVMIVSFSIVFFLCMLLGISGYFGQEYQVGDFVFSKMKARYFEVGKKDYFVIAARFALLISICLTFPMQFYYGRVNCMILTVSLKNKLLHQNNDPQNPSTTTFYITTVILFGAALAIGCFFDKANTIFAFVGAFCGGTMIYILPIVCYFALEGGFKNAVCQAKEKGGRLLYTKRVVFPVGVAVFGLLISISSTIVTFLEYFKVL